MEKTNKLIQSGKYFEDIDSFTKKITEQIVKHSYDESQLGVSKHKLEQQTIYKIKNSIEETQELLLDGLKICQHQLPVYEYDRIFAGIFENFSINKSPSIEAPDSALINDDDYQIILSLTDDLEEKKLFKEALSLYTLLITLAPHDYRSYLNYGLVISEIESNHAGALFFESITEVMSNPLLEYYAANALLDTGNIPKASTLIRRAIETIEQTEESSDETEKVKNELIKFRTTNKL